MASEDNHAKDRIIDLFARKTEAEWGNSVQTFVEKYTPLWLKWVGWIFATGGSAYLKNKTGSVTLLVLEIISYIVMGMYFVELLLSTRIEHYYSWALTRSTKVKKDFCFSSHLCISFRNILRHARVI